MVSGRNYHFRCRPYKGPRIGEKGGTKRLVVCGGAGAAAATWALQLRVVCEGLGAGVGVGVGVGRQG